MRQGEPSRWRTPIGVHTGSKQPPRRRLTKRCLRGACRNTVFPLVDAVEVMNGRGSTRENAFSQEIANRFKMRGTGASDAHKIEDLGSFATEFQRPIGCLEDLIRELRVGRFSPVTLEKRAVSQVKT